ncbi:unnamed protein product, partial [Hapterophycus canaliculatus]
AGSEEGEGGGGVEEGLEEGGKKGRREEEGGVGDGVDGRSDGGDGREEGGVGGGSGGGGEAVEGGESREDAPEAAKAGEEEGVEEGELGSRASVSGSPAAEEQDRLRTRGRRRRLAGAAAVETAAGGSEVGEGDPWSAGAAAGGGGAAESVSLLWIGSPGSNGLWSEPEEGSLWAEAFSRLRLTKWEPQQVSAACRIPCGRWDTLSPKGSTASEEAKAQAGFQCAPTIFVPGTQKGASTFLFHAISWHPQVVQPLRGAHGFKETGRYSPGVAAGPQKLGLRLAAFPFV